MSGPLLLSYGPYTHQPGECTIGIQRDLTVNAAEVPIAVKETWTITGMLTTQAADAAGDIDAQIAGLIAAYSTDGGDLVITLPDGSPSRQTLLNSTTLGGIRVTQQPSFGGGRPAERVTFATYTVKLEAEIALNPQGTILVDYHESLKFRGGTPVLGYLEPAVGFPVPQIFKQISTFKVTQEGNATGYGFQPIAGIDVGFPIWPAAMLPQQTEVDYDAPDRIGAPPDAAYKNFKTTWHYEFESVFPLIGTPTPWPKQL